MKLALLTYFAASLACTTAANADAVKVMPELFGADQLVDIEAHCEGCQPDYCYADKGEPADYACYKDGYPKCCTKDKGNCPNNNKPGCECDGPCNNGPPPSPTPERDEKCFLGDTCPSGKYCEVAEGDCMLRIADIEGRCKTKNEICPYNIDYVCGCNGKTYDNSCAAASAGVNVAKNGKCGDNTRGDKCILGRNGDCGAGEYCKTLYTGDCMLRIAEIEGRCETKSEVCTMDINYVCGCNGKTYSNSCAAASAGVNVAMDDACHEPYSCVGAQGQEFPLCAANDNQNAYCDGKNDCGSTFCDCPVGQDFCDSGVNPCEDEEPYTCVRDQGQEYPLCQDNKNDAGEYCDGGGDCNTSRCACDVGEDFCATSNNPCD